MCIVNLYKLYIVHDILLCLDEWKFSQIYSQDLIIQQWFQELVAVCRKSSTLSIR